MESTTNASPVVVVVAFLREPACRIGKRRYSSAIYGDSLEGRRLVIRGSRSGMSDGPMLEAYEANHPVRVCIHKGGGHLPLAVAEGRVEQVRPGSSGETKREFVVAITTPVPFEDLEFRRADPRDPERNRKCWIKRQFLREAGLRPLSGNLMTCFVKCAA